MTDASNGEPLIGANIITKGTTEGTVTDIDGSLRLFSEQTHPSIIISFTGFEKLEITPPNFTNLKIELEQPYLDDLYMFVTQCYPKIITSIGATYDISNSMLGLRIDNELRGFSSNHPIDTQIEFRLGNNKRLFLETSNEFTISNRVYNGNLNLALEYDLIKYGSLPFDLHNWPNFQRFALIPSLSKRGIKVDLGYINQSRLGLISEDKHGVVLGLGISNIFRSNIDIYGRAELFLVKPPIQI